MRKSFVDSFQIKYYKCQKHYENKDDASKRNDETYHARSLTPPGLITN